MPDADIAEGMTSPREERDPGLKRHAQAVIQEVEGHVVVERLCKGSGASEQWTVQGAGMVHEGCRAGKV